MESLSTFRKNFNLSQPLEKVTYSKDSIKFSNGHVIRVTADNKVFVKNHYFSKNKPLDFLLQEIDKKINTHSSLFQLFLPNAYAGAGFWVFSLFTLGLLWSLTGLSVLESGKDALIGVVASCKNANELMFSLAAAKNKTFVIRFNSETDNIEIPPGGFLDAPTHELSLAIKNIYSKCKISKNKEFSSSEVAAITQKSTSELSEKIKTNGSQQR